MPKKNENEATKIQSLFRRKKAEKKVSAKRAARTWNVLDSHNEELGLKRGKTLQKAKKQIEITERANLAKRQSSEESEDMEVEHKRLESAEDDEMEEVG